MRPLMTPDYMQAAGAHELDPAALKAIAQVESSGSGFLEDGRPKILFEGHVFWARLLQHDQAPRAILAAHPSASGVLYFRWSDRPPDAYKRDQYERLEEARAIDPTEHTEASFESCSWGKFQVMGYHAVTLGYKTVGRFVSEMHKDEAAHLEAALRYIEHNGLMGSVRAKNWSEFARGYNGPGFRKNRYDERLAEAYEAARAEFA